MENDVAKVIGDIKLNFKTPKWLSSDYKYVCVNANEKECGKIKSKSVNIFIKWEFFLIF